MQNSEYVVVGIENIDDSIKTLKKPDGDARKVLNPAMSKDTVLHCENENHVVPISFLK